MGLELRKNGGGDEGGTRSSVSREDIQCYRRVSLTERCQIRVVPSIFLGNFDFSEETRFRR